jgi:hypothetical protein
MVDPVDVWLANALANQRSIGKGEAGARGSASESRTKRVIRATQGI